MRSSSLAPPFSVSLLAPPFSVSLPLSPLSTSRPENPFTASSPLPAEMVLSPEVPFSVSAKPEPMRFSIDDSVSVPSPTVFCAVVVASETVTPATAPT